MSADILSWDLELVQNTAELLNQIIEVIEDIHSDSQDKWGVLGLASTEDIHADNSSNEWTLGLINGINHILAEALLLLQLLTYFSEMKRVDKFNQQSNLEQKFQLYLRKPHRAVLKMDEKQGLR